jgi:hypothetical protein
MANNKYLGSQGGIFDAPYHWPSNEVWPSDVLDQLNATKIESAVVVGSANFCSVAPLTADLRMATFVDVEKGNADLAKSRIRAARATYDVLGRTGVNEQAFSAVHNAYFHYLDFFQPYMGLKDIVAYLNGEAALFDLERSRYGLQGRHYLSDIATLGATANLDIDGELTIVEVQADITEPSDAGLLSLRGVNNGRVGWVHVSNVAPVCFPDKLHEFFKFSDFVERAVLNTARSVIDFVEDVKGVDDETLVTYANYGLNFWHEKGCDIPTVGVSRLGSISPETLITEADVRKCL